MILTTCFKVAQEATSFSGARKSYRSPAASPPINRCSTQLSSLIPGSIRVIPATSAELSNQTNVVEVHLARGAGNRRIAPSAKANRNLVHIGEVHSLIGKNL